MIDPMVLIDTLETIGVMNSGAADLSFFELITVVTAAIIILIVLLKW